jgi:hypothetical protein
MYIFLTYIYLYFGTDRIFIEVNDFDWFINNIYDFFYIKYYLYTTSHNHLPMFFLSTKI